MLNDQPWWMRQGKVPAGLRAAAAAMFALLLVFWGGRPNEELSIVDGLVWSSERNSFCVWRVLFGYSKGFFVCFILRAVNRELYVVIKFRIVCGIWRVRSVLLDLQFNFEVKKATIVSRVIAFAVCALNAQTKQTCCDFHRSKLETIDKTWKSNPKTAFTPSPEMHHSCHNKSPRLKEGGKIELRPDSHSRRHRHHLSAAARSKTALQPHILPWLIF